jgi:pyruvate-formate lyase-activating enzyme
MPDAQVRKFVMIVSVLMTQGCKFNCPYCPIPAAQQKSWRFRSPEAVVEVLRGVYERYRIKYFFGVDDNFFNRREDAEQILSAMAGATAAGRPFGERLRFSTEATQFDTYKHRDLLPLARAVSLQCFVHTPSPGTREYEDTYASGKVIERVGRYTIPESQIDGNHVLVSGGERAWRRQLRLLGAYGAFCNPWNLLRALTRDTTPLRRRRIGFQCAGMLATVWTVLKILP